MSGHNKWSTIKRKKEKVDQERGKIFSKIVRELMMSVKIGGSDPDANTRLRLAIQKAKSVNMPADNIKRAIQKGEAASDSSNLEEILFEAYAPFGIALLIEAVTDNKNRTVPNIKSALSKYNASLATRGSVSYLFNQKGQIIFEPGTSEEKVMDIATNAEVEDLKLSEDGSIEVITTPGDLEKAKIAFDENNLTYASAEVTYIAQNEIAVTEEQAEKVQKLIDRLEEDDDIQAVHSNLTIN